MSSFLMWPQVKNKAAAVLGSFHRTAHCAKGEERGGKESEKKERK